MGQDPILKQLRHIIDLLNRILELLDEINRPKSRYVFWRLFFPYGEFSGQKNAAKQASSIMLDVQIRMDDMDDTLQKRNHPLATRIHELNYLDLKELGDQLMELPTRAQYMGYQIEEYGKKIKSLIKELERSG
ncbi:MAG: hypothetical protein ACFE9D_06885 [Promethearchaeota archaeon]